MTARELRPCPFCGTDDIRYSGFEIHCKTGGLCLCELGERGDEELDALEKRWNTRPTEDRLLTELEEWKRRCEAYRQVAIQHLSPDGGSGHNESIVDAEARIKADRLMKEGA